MSWRGWRRRRGGDCGELMAGAEPSDEEEAALLERALVGAQASRAAVEALGAAIYPPQVPPFRLNLTMPFARHGDRECDEPDHHATSNARCFARSPSNLDSSSDALVQWHRACVAGGGSVAETPR
jgi:hypothetical protein